MVGAVVSAIIVVGSSNIRCLHCNQHAEVVAGVGVVIVVGASNIVVCIVVSVPRLVLVLTSFSALLLAC